MSSSLSACASCHKTSSDIGKSLSKCAKCPTIYCSRECQTHDWKHNNHKVACRAARPTTNDNHAPGFHTVNAMFGDDEALSKMSPKEVYGELIDCYRMRIEDEYAFMGEATGLYAQEDPRPHFKRFLKRAEKTTLLPEWWNAESRAACEEMATRDAWYNINHAVEKSDVQEHYKDTMKPLKLRILGEKIYGRGVM